jgi:hypothetical protein
MENHLEKLFGSYVIVDSKEETFFLTFKKKFTLGQIIELENVPHLFLYFSKKSEIEGVTITGNKLDRLIFQMKIQNNSELNFGKETLKVEHFDLKLFYKYFPHEIKENAEIPRMKRKKSVIENIVEFFHSSQTENASEDLEPIKEVIQLESGHYIFENEFEFHSLFHFDVPMKVFCELKIDLSNHILFEIENVEVKNNQSTLKDLLNYWGIQCSMVDFLSPNMESKTLCDSYKFNGEFWINEDREINFKKVGISFNQLFRIKSEIVELKQIRFYDEMISLQFSPSFTILIKNNSPLHVKMSKNIIDVISNLFLSTPENFWEKVPLEYLNGAKFHTFYTNIDNEFNIKSCNVIETIIQLNCMTSLIIRHKNFFFVLDLEVFPMNKIEFSSLENHSKGKMQKSPYGHYHMQFSEFISKYEIPFYQFKDDSEWIYFLEFQNIYILYEYLILEGSLLKFKHGKSDFFKSLKLRIPLMRGEVAELIVDDETYRKVDYKDKLHKLISKMNSVNIIFKFQK